MATRSSQTYQNRLAFGDPDRKTPEHDQIALWLDANAREITRRLCGLEKLPEGWQWSAEYVQRFHKWVESETQKLLDEARREVERAKGSSWGPSFVLTAQAKVEGIESQPPLGEPPVPEFKITRTVWEQPVTSGTNRFTHGFIDYVAEGYYDVSLRVTLPTAYVAASWNEMEYSVFCFGFEIKANIPSLGEVLRQVQYYRTYEPRMHFVVVSPDTRYVAQIVSQGISFVPYQDIEGIQRGK